MTQQQEDVNNLNKRLLTNQRINFTRAACVCLICGCGPMIKTITPIRVQ